jgi:hypothetical protein
LQHLRKDTNSVMSEQEQERQIRIMITDDKGVEYHLVKPESVVRAIIDPDVPDRFIEVPVPEHLKGAVKHRYLMTNRIAMLDVSDELS